MSCATSAQGRTTNYAGTLLSDIDALGAAELQARGDLSPADLAAIEAAAAEVGALDRVQAGIVDALQARIAG